MKYEYNTQLDEVILKEYGRNIQKIVQYLSTIEDKTERTRQAYNVVELMRLINPATRDSQDYQNKLWDDLFIMSGYQLDVDSPFPMPEVNVLGKKPKKMTYFTGEIAYKHYGRNVELLIDKAFKIQDEEERYYALVQVGRLMKYFYISWNKDNVPDALILEHIEKISKKLLPLEVKERIKSENGFDINIKEKKPNNLAQIPSNGNNKNQNTNKNFNKNTNKFSNKNNNPSNNNKKQNNNKDKRKRK